MKKDKYITTTGFRLYEISQDGLMKHGVEENDYGNTYRILTEDYESMEEAIEAVEETFPDGFCDFVCLPFISRGIDYD